MFVTKYIYFDLCEDLSESVSTLHIKDENVKSTKLGNIIFNFKESFWDAVKSVIGIERNLLSIQESEGIRVERLILLIIEVIQNLYKLSEVKLDNDTGKIVIKLFELEADKIPITEDLLKQELDNILNIDEELNYLLQLGCINMLDGKVSICESIKIDWTR